MRQLRSVLTLAGALCAGQLATVSGKEDPEAAPPDHPTVVKRGIADLERLLGIHEGKFTRTGKGAPVDGTILMRGTRVFDGAGMKLEMIVEVGGERTESLWLIGYLRSPEDETPERLGGTFIASTFDSRGGQRIYEGKLDDSNGVIEWTNALSHPPHKRPEGEPLREIAWRFLDGGGLASTELVEPEAEPGEIVARYRTGKAGAGAEFKPTSAKGGIGVLAKLEPMCGRWTNHWKAEVKRDGEVTEKEGKSELSRGFILGGHFFVEHHIPVGAETDTHEEIAVLGTAGGEGQFEIRMHGPFGANPPTPATWDEDLQGIQIDHEGTPSESFTVSVKVTSRRVGDDRESFENHIHIKQTDGGFEEEVTLKGDVRRVGEDAP